MRLRLTLLAAISLLAVPSTAAAEDYDAPDATGFNPPAAPSPGPSISGSAQAGGTLTGSRGTWQAGTSLASRWLRCDVGTSMCTATGDTDLTYAVTPADVGSVIKLRVVGTRPGGPLLGGTRTVDAVTGAIAAPAAQVSAPLNATLPQVQGVVEEGNLLTVTTGTWTGTDPITYTYGWASCSLGTCRAVSSSQFYRPTAADVGRTLIAGVVARNAVGAGVAQTATGIVARRRTAAGLKRISPFPTLLIGGRVSGSVTRISTLRFRRVSGGAIISARCTGRGCPFRTSKIKVRKGKSRTVALPRLQRRMRAGTTVAITVRKGNTLGKYVRLRFRRRSAPARVDRCVVPKSSKPIKCP